MSTINNTLHNTPSAPSTCAKIILLISGGGSNLQAILNYLDNNTQDNNTHLIQVSAVIADRNAKGLVHAQERNIPTYICSKKTASSPTNLGHFYDIDTICQNIQPTLIVLAGFLGILPSWFTKVWTNKIINIHPSLLPKFGGKGMYGIRVHEAVISEGETESGCSIHWVIEEIDAGAIIAQQKVPVEASDTPQSLQSKILEVEHTLYPKTIVQLCHKFIERSLL